jgi:hypothetical protein
MTYHDLSTDSGSTSLERKEEAKRIIDIITDCVDISSMTTKESDFISDMIDATEVSVKQLFWLRDIKSKYVD